MCYCCRWLSHTLWQRWKVTFWDSQQRKVMLLSGGFGAAAYFSGGNKLCSVTASFCQLSTIPCCSWAEEKSICCLALIRRLVTQRVTLDNQTQQKFHRETMIPALAAQLADCQLQMFFFFPFSPILHHLFSIPAPFLFPTWFQFVSWNLIFLPTSFATKQAIQNKRFEPMFTTVSPYCSKWTKVQRSRCRL